MIKTLFTALMLLCSAVIASEVAINPFEFKQPAPKVSDAYVKQAKEMAAAGNENVSMYLEKMQGAWEEVQKQEGKKEPSDVFIGCTLYQIGGPKSLDEIDLVHTGRVLSGSEREDGKGNYTSEDAFSLVNKWNEHQHEVGYKLWKAWNYYMASCYKYVHGGFIVMPTTPAVYKTYALDQ